MTLTQLRALVRRKLQDEDSNNYHWSTAELTDYINAAYVDFQYRTRFLRTIATDTLASSTATYSLPASCIQMTRMMDQDGIVIPVRTTAYMDRVYGTDWRDTTGNTLSAVVQDHEAVDRFRVYPIPDSNLAGSQVTYDFTYIPTSLATAADIPAIGERYHRTLVWYVLHEAFQKELERQDLEKANMYWSKYLMEVNMATGMVRTGFAKRTGKVDIQRFV